MIMYMNKNTLSMLPLYFILAACDYTPQNAVIAENSSIGATGGIKFTHEEINPKRHMLVVTAAPGIGETEGSVRQRIHQFSIRFAAQTCPEKYEFVNDPNMSQSLAAGFMRRTQTYVFDCK
jgi:hypothetical protein